jgi:hypothetical protein
MPSFPDLISFAPSTPSAPSAIDDLIIFPPESTLPPPRRDFTAEREDDEWPVDALPEESFDEDEDAAEDDFPVDYLPDYF